MTVDTEVMKLFGFWSSILVLKIMAMVPLTGRYRFGKRKFANPDDTKYIKNSTVSYDDPDVERVRRCHRNDLESVLPWFIITFIWLQTGPSAFFAGWLIRTYVLSRIAHTYSYAISPQQPLRVISFLIGAFITIYEAFSALLYYS